MSISDRINKRTSLGPVTLLDVQAAHRGGITPMQLATALRDLQARHNSLLEDFERLACAASEKIAGLSRWMGTGEKNSGGKQAKKTRVTRKQGPRLEKGENNDKR